MWDYLRFNLFKLLVYYMSTFRAFWHVERYRGAGEMPDKRLTSSFTRPLKTKLSHWGFMLGGSLGMLRDILTSKCLTFFFFSSTLCLYFIVKHPSPLSLWVLEQMKNCSILLQTVSKIYPMSCYCSHGNDWCLSNRERTKIILFSWTMLKKS